MLKKTKCSFCDDRATLYYTVACWTPKRCSRYDSGYTERHHTAENLRLFLALIYHIRLCVENGSWGLVLITSSCVCVTTAPYRFNTGCQVQIVWLLICTICTVPHAKYVCWATLSFYSCALTECLFVNVQAYDCTVSVYSIKQWLIIWERGFNLHLFLKDLTLERFNVASADTSDQGAALTNTLIWMIMVCTARWATLEQH